MLDQSRPQIRFRLFWIVVPLIIVGGILIAAAVRVPEIPNKDVIIAVGGALLGLITLLLDELINRVPERRRSDETIALQSKEIRDLGDRLDARQFEKQRSALRLGENLAHLVMGSTESRPTWENILDNFSNLGIHLRDKELAELAEFVSSQTESGASILYERFSKRVNALLDKDQVGALIVGQQSVNLMILMSSDGSEDELMVLAAGIADKFRSASKTPLTPRLLYYVSTILTGLDSLVADRAIKDEVRRGALKIKVLGMRDDLNRD